MAVYPSKYTGAQIDASIETVDNITRKGEGRGLSTEDFTTELKEKLEGLPNSAQESITEENKLDANLIDDTNSNNKFVTEEEKSYIQPDHEAIADKADRSKIEDGSIIAGKALIAKQLENISDESGSYQDTPFIFQGTGTNNNTTETPTAPVAKHLELRGNTVVWNQLVQDGDFATGTGWSKSYSTFTVNNNIGKLEADENNSGMALWRGISIYGRHIYLVKCEIDTSHLENLASVSLYGYDSNTQAVTKGYDFYGKNYIIFTPEKNNAAVDAVKVGFTFNATSGNNLSGYVEFYNFQIFDLTLIYGITSTSDSKANISYFNREYPLPYYDYNAGELKSCNSNKLVTVGYNQFQAQDQFIEVIAGQTYRFVYWDGTELLPLTSGNISEYDGAQNLIQTTTYDNLSILNSIDQDYPQNGDVGLKLTDNTHYIKLTDLSNTNIVINIAWDGSRSEYEEYVTHEYNLPNIELRSTQNTYDSITPDGVKITRVGSYTFTNDDSWRDAGEQTAGHMYRYYSPISNMVKGINLRGLCSKFPTLKQDDTIAGYSGNDAVAFGYGNKHLQFLSNTELTTDQVKALFDGVTIQFPLEQPTTEIVSTFAENIEVDDFGTMKFVSENTESVSNPILPQGNKFFYPYDYVLFIDDLEHYVDGNAKNVLLRDQLRNTEVIQDIENGNIVTGKSLTSKQLENISNESGSMQTTPFTFQATGTDDNTTETPTAPVAKHLELRGNTVVWNQMFQPTSDTTSDFNGVTYTKINDYHWHIEGTPTSTGSFYFYNYSGISDKLLLLANHKYLVYFRDTEVSGIRFGIYKNGSSYVDTKYAIIFTPTEDSGEWLLVWAQPQQVDGSFIPLNLDVYIQIIDLTRVYGAGNEPTDLLQFKRDYPLPYYTYNAGELKSCQSNKLVTVGYNQLTLGRTEGFLSGGVTARRDFDETKYYVGLASNNNYGSNKVTCSFSGDSISITVPNSSDNGYGVAFPVRVIPGYEYTLERTVTDSSLISARYWVSWYDANGNYLSNNVNDPNALTGNHILAPDNAYWGVIVLAPNVGVTTTYSEICFHFAWDSSRTGYEPFVKHEYAMPNVELRKLRSAYDVITNNGAYVRRIGYIDLGSITEWRKVPDGDITIQGAANTFYVNNVIDTPVVLANPGAANMLSVDYQIKAGVYAGMKDKTIGTTTGGTALYIGENGASTPQELEALLAGKILYYELKVPVESQVASFSENIEVDDFGTMEFVSENIESANNPIIPQGNKFFYPADYVLLIDDLNSYTNGDVSQLAKKSDIPTNELPTAPIIDGEYRLVCKVRDGNITYYWAQES